MHVKIKKWLLCATIALPVWSVVLALSFWPAGLGAAWHLLHGSSVIYHGWNVQVPLGSYALQTRDRLMLVRGKARFNSSSEPGAYITLGYYSSGDHPFKCAAMCEKFRNLYSREATTRGYALTARRVVSVANSPAYCFETKGSAMGKSYMVYCNVEGDALMIEYEGPERFLQDFYATLSGMTNSSRSGTGSSE